MSSVRSRDIYIYMSVLRVLGVCQSRENQKEGTAAEGVRCSGDAQGLQCGATLAQVLLLLAKDKMQMWVLARKNLP